MNIKLAAPDQFMPALPGWQDRSEFIAKMGQVEFYHYDFYGQALAKILRSHSHDLNDARAYVRLGKVSPAELSTLFDQVKADLIRFPAIDPVEFEHRVKRFVGEVE